MTWQFHSLDLGVLWLPVNSTTPLTVFAAPGKRWSQERALGAVIQSTLVLRTFRFPFWPALQFGFGALTSERGQKKEARFPVWRGRTVGEKNWLTAAESERSGGGKTPELVRETFLLHSDLNQTNSWLKIYFFLPLFFLVASITWSLSFSTSSNWIITVFIRCLYISQSFPRVEHFNSSSCFSSRYCKRDNQYTQCIKVIDKSLAGVKGVEPLLSYCRAPKLRPVLCTMT